MWKQSKRKNMKTVQTQKCEKLKTQKCENSQNTNLFNGVNAKSWIDQNASKIAITSTTTTIIMDLGI